MALTDTAIRLAKPKEKPYKMSDGGSLSLMVNPNGSKWWRFRYRINGREKMLSFGVYPDVSLKLARDRRDDARKTIAVGDDPGTERKAAKAAQSDTFETIAREWFELQANPPEGSMRAAIAPITARKTKWMLEAFLLPDLRTRPIKEIKAAELFATLRKIEADGIRETAHRTRSLASRIFRYAVATGRADRDITLDLRGALAPIVTKNRAAITDPVRVGELLRAIEGYTGQPTTAYALKISPYVFVRPGELRKATWSEFDLDAGEWRIPAERMKMRRPHRVPLAPQALAILEDAISKARRNGDSFWFPRMPNCIGWIHREIQDFEGALKYDKEGLDVGREKHVLEAEANSLINLGIDHTHAGKHGDTASVFAEAREIFERDKWFRWRYSIRLEAATAEHWLKQGDLAKAKEFTARLFSTASEYKARKYIAVAHQLKAAIAVAEGDINGARGEFNEALAVLDAFPVPVVRWKVLADLGRLLKEAGDGEGSRKAFADAREILEQCASNVTDEQLRSNFLNSLAVKEVMAGANQN